MLFRLHTVPRCHRHTLNLRLQFGGDIHRTNWGNFTVDHHTANDPICAGNSVITGR